MSDWLDDVCVRACKELGLEWAQAVERMRSRIRALEASVNQRDEQMSRLLLKLSESEQRAEALEAELEKERSRTDHWIEGYEALEAELDTWRKSFKRCMSINCRIAPEVEARFKASEEAVSE